MTHEKHKDGRPHHHIAYTKIFKQDLILKPNIPIQPKINEYNMVLIPGVDDSYDETQVDEIHDESE